MYIIKILVVVIGFLLAFGLFCLIERIVSKTEYADGVISGKQFTPAHTTVTYQSVTVGNTTTMNPIIQYYPDDYSVTVSYLDTTSSFSVPEKNYQEYLIGQKVNVGYGIGFFTKIKYGKNFQTERG